MKAIITNFRSIGNTEIEIDPIALVCGLNGAGKTSIARAVAAAATGQAVPYEKVTKKDCGKLLLRHGTHAGSVVLGGDDGTTQVSWPKADVNTTGTPPQASAIACGLVDILALKEKEAVGYLIKLLKAEPTKDDLINALAAEGISKDVSEKIWGVVEAQGWEAAVKRATETGQQRKGAWAQITGTAWGDDKALKWVPENWEDSFENLPPEELQKVIDDAQAKLEGMIAKNAISQAEYDKLVDLAGRMDIIDKELDDANNAVFKATEALDACTIKLAETPNPHAAEEYECPHCKGALHVNPTTVGHFIVAKAVKIDESKKKKLSSEYAGLCGEKARLEGEKAAAQNRVRAAIDEHAKAITAAESIKDKPPLSNNEEGVASARVVLAEAKMRLDMVTRFKAAKLSANIVFDNQKIVAQLSETGVRKKKLAECLDAFTSSYIDPLCNDFGIPVAAIDIDMNITVGTTTFQMLSESEQFRVRVVFQLAIAQIEKASIVIIDRADILDKAGRTRLFTAVINAGIPATLICMTLNSPEQAPNLGASGHGATYWLEKGQCRALAGKAAA